MLILTFRLKGKRFGLLGSEVHEVVPMAELAMPPKVPKWVAGLLNYRGRLIPVLDLCLLAMGEPCARHLSTRIILADYRPEGSAGDLPRLLGLLAEKVTETVRLSPADLDDPGLDTPDARWLGPVAHDAQGLIHVVAPANLLTPEARAMLFTRDREHG